MKVKEKKVNRIVLGSGDENHSDPCLLDDMGCAGA